MTFEEIKALDEQYVMNSYARFPVALDHGQSATLWDVNGKEYIDFTSGIGVNSLGYNHPLWVKAVTDQATKLAHISNLFYTEPYAKVAEKLCTRTGMANVFFANSGAEANEGMIKLARKYSYDKYGKGRSTIITLNKSFHGRTITTLAATGQDKYHDYFFPFTEGFRYADANDMESVEAVAGHDVCAVMFELIQGEGGVNPLTPEFVRAAAKLCADNDIPLMIDEVQTGNGRTGKLYAYQHFGITPDIVSTAKGLGGGLPIGATLMGEKVQNVLQPGDHGSTYGGNPVACAGALSVIERLDDNFLSAVRRKSGYVFATLANAPGIEGVSGLGLMVGIKTTKPAKEVVAKCLEKGVLCLTAKDKVRLLPALNIPMDDLCKALDILKEVCAE